MLTEQEKAQIRTKIRKEQYCITLDQMKQYFKDHQHAREIDDKKTMEKIEYHLTYINFHYGNIFSDCSPLSAVISMV